jgi:hypothetical protein
VLLLPIALFACAPTDDKNADDSGSAAGDTDTDVDSDTDTDADALPDCGVYAGLGAPGRAWSFQVLDYYGATWTYTETLTSVDATTGAVGVSYAGDFDDGAGNTSVLSGTLAWLCDGIGLQLVDSSIHWDSASGGSDDVWAYDPPNVLIPYDPTVTSEWAVSGTHNGVAFATAGSSAPQGPTTVHTAYGDIDSYAYLVTSGSRQIYRAVTEDQGLVWEQDATTAPYPVQDLTAFVP